MRHFFADARVRAGDNRCFAEHLFVAFVLSFDKIISSKKTTSNVRATSKRFASSLPIDDQTTVDAGDAGQTDGDKTHERHDLKSSPSVTE